MLPHSAGADNAEFHALASGSVATTDNETGSATNPRGSVFSDVRPGMLFTYNAPRNIHELMTEVAFLYHFGRSKPNVTFRADWKAFFLPSPRSDMTVGATASSGQLHALSASSVPDETPLLVTPEGRVNNSNVAASQNLSYIASEFSRVWQRGFARYSTTDDTVTLFTTEGFEAGAAVGFDRRMRMHNFVFEVGGSFLRFERLDPMMVQMGDRLDRQLNPRAVFVWQWDIDKKWSTNVDAGVVYVNPVGIDPYNPTEEREAAPFPVFGALAAYTDVWGRAQAQARRAVTPNLLIAQNTISDSVNVTFALPLAFLDKDSSRRRPRVVGIGTLGADRTQLIDPVTSTLEGEFKVVRLDLSVGWQPRPGQTLGLRYQFSYQDGDTVAEMVVPSFYRNTFYFTFALRWPEDIQVRVPRRGQSVRADRTDLAPIGAEPVIIDPSELFEEGDGR